MTSKEIGTLALQAMLFEVSATPKPGLVDRNNSGAHKDMGFFTFLESAASLRSSFEEFARTGESMKDFPPVEIFPVIRKIGIDAEKIMFAATNGINTHKGEIFSLGVLSACAAFLSARGEKLTTENITAAAAEMCAGLCEKDFAGVHEKKFLTKGEKVFVEHGISGIRGEAEAGYPVVKNIALPALKKYLAKNLSVNDALAFTLIHIMAEAHDTNIISRHDLETANEIMRRAKKILSDGITIEEILKLDQEFIARNISPGGAGDLLSVTYFLNVLQDKN